MSPHGTPCAPRRSRPSWHCFAALALSAALLSSTPAQAQLSISVELPGASIGINVPLYPRLERVANYPVYYAPDLPANYFFYDGLYWVFTDDDWYSSTWYNGPWRPVRQQVVPAYLLRVPVRYYRSRPSYFRGWRADAPPRWDAYWGPEWQRQRHGWDRWDHHAMPPPAPLPRYQRNYSADRYPRLDEQLSLRRDHYHYLSRESFAQQHFQQERLRRHPRANGPDQPIRDSRPADRQPQQRRGEPGRAPGPDAGAGPVRGRAAEADRGHGRGRDKDREPDRDREQGRGQGR